MIWLTKAFCVQRHCAWVVAWDDETWTRAEGEAAGTKQALARGEPSECSTCGGELVLESRQTAYRTVEEMCGTLGVTPEPPLPPDTPDIRFPGER